MSKKVYDHIVYGAGAAGIIYACALSKKGHSVILINRFGFPGGSITESLNCFQNINCGTSNSAVRRVIKLIEDETRGVFLRSEGGAVLNPETVKIVLQNFITEHNIDLLYHVTPAKVKYEKDLITAVFSAKEGEISICGKLITDASADLSLFYAGGGERRLMRRSVNIFITSSGIPDINEFKNIERSFKLDDGRYLIYLHSEDGEKIFGDNKTQEILDSFNTEILKRSSRIQLLPLQHYSAYLPDRESDKQIATLYHIAGKMFGAEEEFLQAELIEKYTESGNER